MVNSNTALELRDRIFWVPVDLERLPPHKERTERLYAGIISLARNIMQAQGLRITVLGAENIPADGGAVLAMNHTSYYDFILGGVPAYCAASAWCGLWQRRKSSATPSSSG